MGSMCVSVPGLVLARPQAPWSGLARLTARDLGGPVQPQRPAEGYDRVGIQLPDRLRERGRRPGAKTARTLSYAVKTQRVGQTVHYGRRQALAARAALPARGGPQVSARCRMVTTSARHSSQSIRDPHLSARGRGSSPTRPTGPQQRRLRPGAVHLAGHRPHAHGTPPRSHRRRHPQRRCRPGAAHLAEARVAATDEVGEPDAVELVVVEQVGFACRHANRDRPRSRSCLRCIAVITLRVASCIGAGGRPSRSRRPGPGSPFPEKPFLTSYRSWTVSDPHSAITDT